MHGWASWFEHVGKKQICRVWGGANGGDNQHQGHHDGRVLKTATHMLGKLRVQPELRTERAEERIGMG